MPDLTASHSFWKGLSLPIKLFTAKSMGSQRDPESHWHRSTIFPNLTCVFNPCNTSLVRLYRCNPEPIDLSGKLPTDSSRISVTACTHDIIFSFKSWANLPHLWLAEFLKVIHAYMLPPLHVCGTNSSQVCHKVGRKAGLSECESSPYPTSVLSLEDLLQWRFTDLASTPRHAI